MVFSKSWTFRHNYGMHMKSWYTSNCHSNYTSNSTWLVFSMHLHQLLGFARACTGPCMKDPNSMHMRIHLACSLFCYK
jgi:hypothetical protein